MNRIKKQREDLRYLQKDIAQMLGIKTPQYQRYESGVTLPNVFMARRIAKILNVRMDTFIEWLEDVYNK
jgi:transcriptional regulator with XRE-family HTH domain